MISKEFLEEHSASSGKELDAFYSFLLERGDIFEVEFFSRLFTKVSQWSPGEDADNVFLESYEEAFEEFRVRGSIPTDYGVTFQVLHMVVTNAKRGVEFFKALSFFYRAMISQCEFEIIAFQAENGEASS